MLDILDPFYREQTAGILLLVIAEPDSLDLLAFAFTDEQSPVFALNANVPWMTSDDLSSVESDLTSRLKASCIDLLDVAHDRGSNICISLSSFVVEFLHRTVKDFLQIK